jgi:hypothetical protein
MSLFSIVKENLRKIYFLSRRFERLLIKNSKSYAKIELLERLQETFKFFCKYSILKKNFWSSVLCFIPLVPKFSAKQNKVSEETPKY